MIRKCNRINIKSGDKREYLSIQSDSIIDHCEKSCFPNNYLTEATMDIYVYIYGIQIEVIRNLWVISAIDPFHLNHRYHEFLYR